MDTALADMGAPGRIATNSAMESANQDTYRTSVAYEFPLAALYITLAPPERSFALGFIKRVDFAVNLDL